MSEESKSPAKTIKEWWGVIIVAVGVAGGFIWLNEQFVGIKEEFAKNEALIAQRDALQKELDEQKSNLQAEMDVQKSNLNAELAIRTCEVLHRIGIEDAASRAAGYEAELDTLRNRQRTKSDPTEEASSDRKAFDSTIRETEIKEEDWSYVQFCLAENLPLCAAAKSENELTTYNHVKGLCNPKERKK